MAVYRQIQISFWQDVFILELTPEEKYFYIYLMTNSKTTQCGVYELPKKVIEFETGYNRETVDKLLKRFIEYGKIEYCEETKEVALLNWLKHNSFKSPKVLTRIEKEIELIKYKPFRLKTIDRLSIDYTESVDTQSQKEEEKEEEKEEVLEEEREAKIGSSPPDEKLILLVKAYEQNGFGQLSQIVKEELIFLIDEYDITWINEAFKIAVENNKRTLKYVKGILKNWRVEGGMKTETIGVKKSPPIPHKKTRFHNLESRTDKYSDKQLQDVADRKREEWRSKQKKAKEKTDNGSGLAFLEQYKESTS